MLRAPRSLAPFVGAAALLLGSTFAGLVPTHAFADSGSGSPTPAVTFRWNVQLDNGKSIAGISPDLPDAIQLAEMGETLTPAQMAMITSALTDEAQQENASLTAIPVPPAPAPAAVVPSDDSGE
jgi:hypothetical protein